MTPTLIWAGVVLILGIITFTALLVLTEHTEELRMLILFTVQFILQFVILIKVHQNGPKL